MRRHVRLDVGSSTICRSLSAVLHGNRWVGLGRRVRILRRVRSRGNVVTPAVVVTAVVLSSPVVSGSRLGAVWDHLHASGDGASRRAASGCVGRGSGAAKSIVELLEERAADIVSSNVNGISNAHDYERAFAGHGKAGIRGIEPCARGFLNLTNAGTTLSNDGANKNMRDQQTEGVSLGRSGRGLVERLVVQCSDNETEGLTPKLALVL